MLSPLPHGVLVPGKNSFIELQGVNGHRRPVQGRDRVGIVEGSCGYRARVVSIRGKFILLTNPGYTTRGIAMWLNAVLTPG